MGRLGAATLLVFMVAGATACSEDTSAPPQTTTARQSFECVAAIQRTGLTTGTPAGVARERLEALVADESLTAEERQHHEAQLEALKGVDPTEEVGNRLDSVPCDL